MKILIYLVIILLISKQAISETALSCNMVKSCVKSAGECKEIEDDSKNALIIINEDNTKLIIRDELVFQGEYIITNKTDVEFKGLRISDLENHNLIKLREIIKRRDEKTISEEEFENIFYIQIFKGLTFQFIINRFSLELETKMVYSLPPRHDVGIKTNYKCELIERKI